MTTTPPTRSRSNAFGKRDQAYALLAFTVAIQQRETLAPFLRQAIAQHLKGTLAMSDKNTPAAVPTFAPVAVADLGTPAGREASPETIALGNAILSVIADGTNAAQDPTTYTDRKEANKRAAVLKRAVLATGKVPEGKTAGARIILADGTYRVAVLLSNAKPRKAK